MSHERTLAVFLSTFLVACAATHRAASAPVDRDAARAAFERLKALEGDWIGKSTKGWTETIRYQTIAAGSCVEESSFDAHPNERILLADLIRHGQLLIDLLYACAEE